MVGDRKVERPTLEQLLNDFIVLKSQCAVARKYGVSDKSIEKWKRQQYVA